MVWWRWRLIQLKLIIVLLVPAPCIIEPSISDKGSILSKYLEGLSASL